ncbi:MAG: diguanylate cyclase [Pseudomonadota bacterium]
MRHRPSIHRGFLFLPLLVAMVVAWIAYSEYSSYRGAVAQAEADSNNLIAHMTLVLSSPLHAEKFDQVSAVFTSSLRDSRLRRLSIHTASGDVLNQFERPSWTRRPDLSLVQPLRYVDADGIHYLGYIEAAFSFDDLRGEFRDAVTRQSGFVVLFAIIVTALWVASYRLTVHRGLTMLLQGIHAALAGEERRVEWPGTDLIARIAEQFNQLLERQSRALVELKGAKLTLEERIAERTQTLEESIERTNEAQEDLFAEKAKLEAIFSAISECLLVVGSNGEIQYLNPSACRTLGVRLDDVIDQQYCDYYLTPQESSCLEETLLTGVRNASRKPILLRVPGNEIFVQETASPIRSKEGRLTAVAMSFFDVTEQWAKEKRLEYRATYDALTGLLNRHAFKEGATDKLRELREVATTHVLILFDLNDFKGINDTHGHYAGDQYLAHFARMISTNTKSTDLVSRLGGDEFAVVLFDAGREEADRYLERQFERFTEEPFGWGNVIVPIAAASGMAVFGADALTLDDAYQEADAALYAAKPSHLRPADSRDAG